VEEKDDGDITYDASTTMLILILTDAVLEAFKHQFFIFCHCAKITEDGKLSYLHQNFISRYLHYSVIILIPLHSKLGLIPHLLIIHCGCFLTMLSQQDEAERQ